MRRWRIGLAVGLGTVGTTVLLAAALVSLVVAIRLVPQRVPSLWRVPYSGLEVGAGVDLDAYLALEEARRTCRARFRIRSGYRSVAHNLAVGGVRNSEHTRGRAFDVTVPMAQRPAFYACARDAGFTGFGWGNYTVHIDMGPKRWWTYDDQGKTADRHEKYSYLHKAPSNFRADWNL